MIRNIFITAIILAANLPLYSQASSFAPQIEILKWRWGYNSAFSFTFDDGLLSQTQYAAPVLDQFGFKGTFYVLPPFLKESSPAIWRYGYWPDYQVVSWNGHEVGSHTLNHPYLTSLPAGDTLTPNTIHYELYHSQQQINNRLNTRCVSIAYPYSDHNPLVDSLTKIYFKSGRSVGPFPNHDSSIQFYSLTSYPVTFSLPRNSTSDDLDELNDFICWTENSITDSSWGIIMIHEVVPFAQVPDLLNQGLYEPMSTEWLSAYCTWLEAKSNNAEVWVETAGNVIKYIKERNNTSSQIISSNEDEIKFRLIHNLEPDIYNYNLTLLAGIPDQWESCYLNQASRYDSLVVFQSHLGNTVMVDAIPDGTEITLSRNTLTNIDEATPENFSFKLNQNYPNPFNPVTTITYQLYSPSNITLKIYDVLGNELKELFEGYKTSGSYEVKFDAHEFPSGIYFYRLSDGNSTKTMKMILLK
ncbi:MAG: polysaccharide deacetylase family protein [Ignavibacteriales bacterium]|nr:MAG: polysaccharide deacetylase family protein [Ignavibacteriales bacterium]